MIDEKAVTRGAPGSRPLCIKLKSCLDIQRELSLKLHHTGILECIPFYAIKSYSTVVQM